MKKLSVSLVTSMLMICLLGFTNVFAQDLDTQADGALGVTYRTHIQNEGWAQGWMADGALSGSEGKGLRLEGIEIELSGTVPEGLGIQYQTHIQNKGWSQGWVNAGELSGSVGEGLRLEAINIKLTGTNASDYSVRYRTHIQNEGWNQGWVADGALSGSEGKGLRLEAIEIVIVETPAKIAYDDYQSMLNKVAEDDYTTASWADYQKVVTANVVSKTDTVDKITTAIAAIEKAQISLVKKADLTAYNDVLDNVTEAQCTPESWAVYQAVVTANAVTGDNTQSEVDAATVAIMQAQKNLVLLADLTAYNAALAAVTQDQVKSGWAEYQAVVAANVVTNKNTQAQVDAATIAILNAQKNLVLYSNLSAFNEAIKLYVQNGANPDNVSYTSATWNAYVAKCETYGTLTSGVWVYDVISKNSDQSVIDAATAAINAELGKLVKTADLTAFYAAKNIKQADGPYTTVSFTAYTNDSQVKTITSISADTLKSYPQSVVDGYTNTLIALQHSLLVIGGDLTAYNALLAGAKQADFTAASWSTYQTVVSANVVTPDNSQTEIDGATAKISSAQKNLVYSAAYIVSKAKINSTYFGVRTVGDNILTRASDMITAAGYDSSDYTVSFTRVDNGTAVINPTTGVITNLGSSSATVTFTITPKDGSAAASTANVDILINPLV